MAMTASTLHLADLLPDDLALGEPQIAGALAVLPLLGRSSTLDFLSFAEAAPRGFTVKELDKASVNDLLAVNPLDRPVLLYEGEEVQGAQQDRTVDVPVLVPAGAKLHVPVSCVEHGRWDGRRHGESFTPSPQAAYPELRARKAAHARAALAAGREARADQHEVWAAVAGKADRHQVDSDTGAMSDIYERRGDRLADLERAFSRLDGQVGALVCIAGQPRLLDFVSRSDAFAALWQPLLRGYCLDALEAPADGEPRAGAPEEFLAAVTAGAPEPHPTVGLGTLLAFQGSQAAGTGLGYQGELVALSVFEPWRRP